MIRMYHTGQVRIATVDGDIYIITSDGCYVKEKHSAIARSFGCFTKDDGKIEKSELCEAIEKMINEKDNKLTTNGSVNCQYVRMKTDKKNTNVDILKAYAEAVEKTNDTNRINTGV